ncbi:MAG: hypothetical protein ACXAEU_05340, partial [Candidatus Hodarchaeales archaeon]
QQCALYYSKIIKWILSKVKEQKDLSEEEIAAWEQGNKLIQDSFKLDNVPARSDLQEPLKMTGSTLTRVSTNHYKNDNHAWEKLRDQCQQLRDNMEVSEPLKKIEPTPSVARTIYRGFAMDNQRHHDDLFIDLTPFFGKWNLGTFLIVDGVSKAHGRIATEITCKTIKHLTRQPQFTDIYDRNDMSLFEKFQAYTSMVLPKIQEILILYKEIIKQFDNRKTSEELYRIFFNLIGTEQGLIDKRIQRAIRTDDNEEYLHEILSWIIDDPVEVVRRVVSLSEPEQDFQLATTVILAQVDGEQACYVTVGDGYVGAFKYTEVAENRFINVMFQGNDTPLNFTLMSDDVDIDSSYMVFKPTCPGVLLFGSDGLVLKSEQVRKLFEQCFSNHFDTVYDRANDNWTGDLITQEDLEVLAKGFIEILESRNFLKDDATVGITFIDPTGIIINGKNSNKRKKDC